MGRPLDEFIFIFMLHIHISFGYAPTSRGNVHKSWGDLVAKAWKSENSGLIRSTKLFNYEMWYADSWIIVGDQ